MHPIQGQTQRHIDIEYRYELAAMTAAVLVLAMTGDSDCLLSH